MDSKSIMRQIELWRKEQTANESRILQEQRSADNYTRQANDYQKRANDALRSAEPYKQRIEQYKRKNLDLQKRIDQYNKDLQRELERERRR